MGKRIKNCTQVEPTSMVNARKIIFKEYQRRKESKSLIAQTRKIFAQGLIKKWIEIFHCYNTNKPTFPDLKLMTKHRTSAEKYFKKLNSSKLLAKNPSKTLSRLSLFSEFQLKEVPKVRIVQKLFKSGSIQNMDSNQSLQLKSRLRGKFSSTQVLILT